MSNHARRVLVGAVTVKDVQKIRRNTMIFRKNIFFVNWPKAKRCNKAWMKYNSNGRSDFVVANDIANSTNIIFDNFFINSSSTKEKNLTKKEFSLGFFLS